MKASTFYFKGKESLTIHVYKWMPEEEQDLKGIVQIAHGMSETGIRYERFAKFLTDNGYGVYINDHRGHGKTAGELANVGYLGERDSISALVEDMHLLTQRIKTDYPKVPIFLLGHSMGSFAAQGYMMAYGDLIKGVMLSGSSGRQGILLDIAIWLAKREAKKHDRKKQSPKLEKLVFGGYNKQFKPGRTQYDWLSRDEEEVDKYIADPFCGTTFTVGFYEDLFNKLKFIGLKENMIKVPKNLPIYLFSGDKDPVGKNGKSVLRLYEDYKEIGIKNVSIKLYPEGRHEMLNETNRDEVMKDLLDWLTKISSKL